MNISTKSNAEKYQYLKVGLVDPRAWILATVEEFYPDILCAELAKILYARFQKILQCEHFMSSVESGGCYRFQIISGEHKSEWVFGLSPCDYPGDGAFLSLRPYVDDYLETGRTRTRPILSPRTSNAA